MQVNFHGRIQAVLIVLVDLFHAELGWVVAK